jgi:hypothetical protein
LTRSNTDARHGGSSVRIQAGVYNDAHTEDALKKIAEAEAAVSVNEKE